VAQNPPRYFPPRYFAGRYWATGEVAAGAIAANITASASLTADLTSTGAANDITATLSGSASLSAALTTAAQVVTQPALGGSPDVTDRLAQPYRLVTPRASAIGRTGLHAVATVIRGKTKRAKPAQIAQIAQIPQIDIAEDDLFVMTVVTAFLAKTTGTKTHGIVG